MIVYIVQMEKQDYFSDHTVKDPGRYVVGVYTDPEEARKAGLVEQKYRNTEYKYLIHDYVLDHINENKLEKYVRELMTENLWQKR
jgi:hypothetical protein